MAESLDVASVSGAPFGVSARHASGLTLEPVEAAVVAAIRRAGPLSRTDLAERLDYSRASLTAIVGRMIAAGVLSEVGEGKSAGGRRPYPVSYTHLDVYKRQPRHCRRPAGGRC